jgi:hypothetical protein
MDEDGNGGTWNPIEAARILDRLDALIVADRIVIEAYIATAGLPMGAEAAVRQRLVDEFGISL